MPVLSTISTSAARRGACRRRHQARWLLPVVALGVLALRQVNLAVSMAFTSPPQVAGSVRTHAPLTIRRSSPADQIENPVKTVSQMLQDFYKLYPQPLLPMYRPFLVDIITQLHLSLVDSRFKYDAIFGLGVREIFMALMGNYDKITQSEATDKIWEAAMGALGMDAAKVIADAEAATAYAKSTSPSDILNHMEGKEAAPNSDVDEAFKGIKDKLYSMPFSIGLFKIMEYATIEPTKANVEEWVKVLQVPTAKATSDLDTYRKNQDKLQKAEELMREVEIREKKKLAERLEEKAKALAAKAAAKETPQVEAPKEEAAAS